MGPGIAEAAAALAVLLSVVVRSIRSGSSWQAIDDGVATAEHLRDVTGILEFQALQEAFGPPRMEDGVFPVTRAEVRRHKSGLGYLLGDKWFDGGSALVAVVVLLPVWPLWGTRMWLDLLLVFASVYQVAGWVASTRFVGGGR